MLKRLQPELYSIPPQTDSATSMLDVPLKNPGCYSVSGWQMAESARVSLQCKAKSAQKRNQGFFTVTHEPREQNDVFLPVDDEQINAQFTDWVKGIESISEGINLLDLPENILKELKAISRGSESNTLHQTETVQPTRPQ